MTLAPRRNSRGYLVGLAATVALSFTGILMSYLSRTYNLPSLVLAFWRDCFVVLGLATAFAVFSPKRFRVGRGLRGFFILYGLSLALFNTTWTFSVELNGAAVATVLAFSSPAITAVLAHYFLGEKITGVKRVSIALSLVGTVLVSGAANPAAWTVNAAGIVFGLLTGLFFAVYNIVGKSSANRAIDPWTTMLHGFSYAVGFLFVLNAAVNLLGGQAATANLLWLGNAWGGWAVLILLGIGPTIGGYGLYLLSLGYLSATVANLIGALEPVFTTIWAYIVFAEELSGMQLIGSLIILGSVALLRLGDRPEKAATTK